MIRLAAVVFLSAIALINFGFAEPSDVKAYQLSNGLTVLVKPDHRAPVAVFEIWYHVGAADENTGTTGISHFLEHMMFRGTTQYPDGQFAKMIAANGGQENAFTTNDYTGYYEMMSADKLPLSFQLESDRMQHLLLDANAVTTEHQVIMEERRMRIDDDPMSFAYERFLAAAFLNNPYQHPTIGWMSDMQQLNQQDLESWYHTWYVPNNATIVVVGDVDPDQVYQLAEKYFGSIPSRALPTRAVYVSPPAVGEKQVVVNRTAQVPAIFMGFNVPVVKTDKTTWEPYALMILAAALDNDDSSILDQRLIRDQQIAAGVDVDYSAFSRYDNLFSIVAVPSKNANIAQLQAAIWQQLNLLKQEPLSLAQLQKIKQALYAQEVYSQDSLLNQANELGSFASVGLPWQLSQTYLENINAVTAAQVQSVAKRYLSEDNLTITILQPQTGLDVDQAFTPEVTQPDLSEIS
ncbi:MAG: putative Peptidase [Gammaproteobacteria bacterium]|jgi:zinc protease|nr:putative Peptidase [Gammaproteobacteria bacterium]